MQYLKLAINFTASLCHTAKIIEDAGKDKISDVLIKQGGETSSTLVNYY